MKIVSLALGTLAFALSASVSLLSVNAEAAPPTQYGYECNADGKAIVMKYSYASGYELDLLTVDGTDHTFSGKVNIFRGSGVLFTIENYRAGKSMVFGINTPSGTYYQLDGGTQYPMTCTAIKQPAKPADDRL